MGGQGAGDILARFRRGKTASAHKLLARVAGVFVQTGNIYESYNMSGGRGGDTGGNYLEHCSGYAWTVSEGAFGIDFGRSVGDRSLSLSASIGLVSLWLMGVQVSWGFAQVA